MLSRISLGSFFFCVRFEGLRVLIAKIGVFWDLMPRSQPSFMIVQEEAVSSVYRAEDGGNRLFQNV